MANARKCDKCHRCFDPAMEIGQMAKFRNPIFQNAHEIQENVIGELLLNHSNPDAVCDLCPECAAMFKLFMKEPKACVIFPNDKPVFDDRRSRENKQMCVGYKYRGIADIINRSFNSGGDYDGD